jgi:rod shape determining protein RodA
MARPFFEKVDWIVVLAVVALAIVSLLTLHSVSSSGGGRPDVVAKQAGWFLVGFLLIALVTSIDYHILSALAYPIYVAVTLALVAVLAIGDVVQGSQRWIRVGPASLQPSELSKIALILVLAKYFSSKKKEKVYLLDLIFSGSLFGIFVVLILKEPDLGTSVLLFPIFVAIVFVAGLDLMPVVRIVLFRPVLILLIVGMLFSFFYTVQFESYWRITDTALVTLKQRGVPAEILDRLESLKPKQYTAEKTFLGDIQRKIGKERTATYQTLFLEYSRPRVRLMFVPPMWMWLNLKEYQRDRLISFLDPDRDPLGAGYHIIQSQIAIGSGGFWGKGYMNGTQSQLKFLPEQFTDFIFSVFSEEWGFLGSIGLLAIYMTIVLRGLAIASKAKDKLGRLIAVGVITIILVHTFVNVGVTTGIMPVTGLTLPLMSYGGSSIVSTSIALGLLLNVSYRRFDF